MQTLYEDLQMAILISDKGHIFNVRPNNGQKFTLEELQKFVGGKVELITMPSGLQIWLNEEGKLLNLRANAIASLVWQTVFYGKQGWLDSIRGSVLICPPSLTN